MPPAAAALRCRKAAPNDVHCICSQPALGLHRCSPVIRPHTLQVSSRAWPLVATSTRRTTAGRSSPQAPAGQAPLAAALGPGAVTDALDELEVAGLPAACCCAAPFAASGACWAAAPAAAAPAAGPGCKAPSGVTIAAPPPSGTCMAGGRASAARRGAETPAGARSVAVQRLTGPLHAWQGVPTSLGAPEARRRPGLATCRAASTRPSQRGESDLRDRQPLLKPGARGRSFLHQAAQQCSEKTRALEVWLRCPRAPAVPSPASRRDFRPVAATGSPPARAPC